MSIRKYITSVTLSGILLFTWLSMSNANEVSIESQLKEQVDQANLEQEIIAIIAEQIESDIAASTVNDIPLPTDTLSASTDTIVAATPIVTADVESAANSKIDSEVSDGLRKSLQAIVQDAESGIDKQLSDYRKSITPKNTEKETTPAPIVEKQKQVKRSETTPQRSKAVENRIIAKKEVKPSAPTPSVSVSSNVRKDKGWIYLGQFTDSRWGEKMLKIGNELPRAGKNYLLNFSVNIRDARPSKRGMSKVINILSTGDKIKILNIHLSGKKGHYWALVEWLKRR